MDVLVKFERILDTCFPRSLVGKESACNAGDSGSTAGLGRSSEEGNDNPFQYSCLENPMDRGAWQATVHGVARVGHDLETKERENDAMLVLSLGRVEAAGGVTTETSFGLLSQTLLTTAYHLC